MIDPLTGLLNRRGLQQGWERELARYRRSGENPSVVVADLDAFKQFNDRYGHIHGDLALRETANTLRRILRQSDLVARIGGEEFVMVLPRTELKSAVVLVERIRIAVESLPLAVAKGEAHITASCGITASQNRPEITLEEMIQEADQAMYRAKRAGRNQAHFFSASTGILSKRATLVPAQK